VFVDAFGTAADVPSQMDPGWLLADGLHLSESGYQRWIAALREAVQTARRVATHGD
jgi:lysophospholipase L1-like esterase